MGANVELALGEVNVPCYVVDRTGTIRWLNAAAERIVGHAQGARFTDVVAPAYKHQAREAFSRKILGVDSVTDVSFDVVGHDGVTSRLEVSSAPLYDDHRVIGVFGIASRPAVAKAPPRKHHHLTPRQSEVLHMLAHGASTTHIAEELHLSRETVRNHVRAILRALEVNSRLEAVATAHADGLITI
jgi:PAS domain S-box-containing protein